MIDLISLSSPSITGPTGSVLSIQGADPANVFRVDGEPVALIEGSIYDWVRIPETEWWVRCVLGGATRVMVSWGKPLGVD